MNTYHNIKINHNSDCWAEIDALREMMKQNKGYLAKDYTNSEIIAIAIDELYDKLAAERKAGNNQRRV